MFVRWPEFDGSSIGLYYCFSAVMVQKLIEALKLSTWKEEYFYKIIYACFTVHVL